MVVEARHERIGGGAPGLTGEVTLQGMAAVSRRGLRYAARGGGRWRAGVAAASAAKLDGAMDVGSCSSGIKIRSSFYLA